MKRGFLFSAALAAAFAFAIPALAGVQVTTCQDLGGGVWRYTFFACAPNVDANDLHINLLGSEITSGESVVGCAVPALAGFSCSSTATGASYFFPQIGPFECVPALPGDANKFVIDIQTADGVSLVEEVWTLDGVTVAGFTSVIACPPVSVEGETWGRVKSLYR
ncbi:MAG: hypothetical protein R3B81_02180 [bacterium]